jgi:hypothetical protein
MKDVYRSSNEMPLRPPAGFVIERIHGHHTIVVTRVVETDAAIVVHTETRYDAAFVKKEKQKYTKLPISHDWLKPQKLVMTTQKFLCVNGDLRGCYRVPEEAPGYEVYNRSARWSPTHNLKNPPPKCILVMLPSP